MEEYIIINKTAIQQRMEELEKTYQNLNDFGKHSIGQNVLYEIKLYNEILSQSTPLIPEIEKAILWAWDDSEDTQCKEDYISNLKLDI